MTKITLKGHPINTIGALPLVGEKAPDFHLVKTDLSRAKLADFIGKRMVLNIFPSIDTGTCANSVRKFNELAAAMEDTLVLCISRDLPFAQKRFCAAEGLEKVIPLSDYENGSFGKSYGLTMEDGPLAHLLSRAIIIIDQEGRVRYTQQVSELSEVPDYQAALEAL